RPYLLARRTNLSLSAVLGTTVVERVVDGLLITGLLFITLAFYRGEHATGFAISAGLIAAAVFVPTLLVCIFALAWKEPTIRVLGRIGDLVSSKLTAKLLGLLSNFIDGFRALIQADYLGRFILLTALYWTTNALSMWLFARFGFGL